MDILELCQAIVASLDATPGSKPLRTYVDEDGNFTIEEGGRDGKVERCTGYAEPGGRGDSPHLSQWRQLLLGASY